MKEEQCPVSVLFLGSWTADHVSRYLLPSQLASLFHISVQEAADFVVVPAFKLRHRCANLITCTCFPECSCEFCKLEDGTSLERGFQLVA